MYYDKDRNYKSNYWIKTCLTDLNFQGHWSLTSSKIIGCTSKD